MNPDQNLEGHAPPPKVQEVKNLGGRPPGPPHGPPMEGGG